MRSLGSASGSRGVAAGAWNRRAVAVAVGGEGVLLLGVGAVDAAAALCRTCMLAGRRSFGVVGRRVLEVVVVVFAFVAAGLARLRGGDASDDVDDPADGRFSPVAAAAAAAGRRRAASCRDGLLASPIVFRFMSQDE